MIDAHRPSSATVQPTFRHRNRHFPHHLALSSFVATCEPPCPNLVRYNIKWAEPFLFLPHHSCSSFLSSSLFLSLPPTAFSSESCRSRSRSRALPLVSRLNSLYLLPHRLVFFSYSFCGHCASFSEVCIVPCIAPFFLFHFSFLDHHHFLMLELILICEHGILGGWHLGKRRSGMANGSKPRDELKNLQEDLGPYFHTPLLPRRRGTSTGEATLQETLRQQSNTPEPKRQRRDTSSRDSTPVQHNRQRSKGGGGSKRQTPGASTPKRTPPRSEPASQNTPKQDSAKQDPPSREMSQRNRPGRGSNRNNGNSHGEEVQIWENCKSQVNEIIAGINQENDSLAELVALDKQVGAMESDKIPGDSLQNMEKLCRSGVKLSEANTSSLNNLIDQLRVLRAVVVAKEQAEAQAAGPGKRQARDNAAAASSLYDFDGAGDSPVPSPIGGSSRKYGDRSSNRDRDSMPPKADSVEPQGSSGSGAGSAGSNKSKVLFSRGDAVAFKPRPTNGDQTQDWILGEVAQVLGEGKSRRYKVLDIEPEDQSKQKEYRSSASSMIPIAPESQASTLKPWEAGKVVLALYPNTTTFYKAEVHSMGDDGKVNLKFEGENDSTTLQQVERRFVIEYRA
ncbi:SGF29 tudor-like domain-containing protein [Mariannaea sp. PMI_226]|nr:SGF29 tudor-like domain-containing protein [Mariannaea sp. PMI_226]